MAPTLVASYLAKTSTAGAGAITTASFTPSNGEILVIKAETWSTGTSMSTPTGGSQTYTSRVAYAPGGFREWAGIWTAVVSGSPGSMTVSSTPSASAQCSILVERWSGATLGGTPVTATANASSGAASGSLTTTAANSVISWVVGDAQSVDPATRALLGSGTDEGVRDGHVGSNGVGYYGYQNVAAAGATSFGLSAPTGMQFAIAGIEVLAAAGGTTYNQSASGGITPAGALVRQAAKLPAGSITPAGALVRRAARTLAGALTPAGAVVRQAVKALAGGLTPAGALVRRTGKAMAGALAPAGAATGLKLAVRALAGSLAPAGTLARLTAKTVAGGITPSGALRRAVAKTLAGTLGAAGVLVKAGAKRLLGGLTPAGAITASTGPPPVQRDLQLVVGSPEAHWAAGQPGVGWTAGPPESRWTAGPPEV